MRRAALVALLVVGAVGCSGADEPGPPSPTAVATASATVSPATGQVVTAGAVSLTLPDGWRGSSVADGATAAGARIYPDDPTEARRIAAAIRPEVLLLGVDPDPAAFSSNVNVIVDDSIPAGASLAATADVEARALATSYDVQDRRAVRLGALDAVRFAYSTAQQASVAYVVKPSGTTYIVTFSFRRGSPAGLALADSSAATFRVG